MRKIQVFQPYFQSIIISNYYLSIVENAVHLYKTIKGESKSWGDIER